MINWGLGGGDGVCIVMMGVDLCFFVLVCLFGCIWLGRWYDFWCW